MAAFVLQWQSLVVATDYGTQNLKYLLTDGYKLNCIPPNSYVEVLIPSNSECECLGSLTFQYFK